MARKSNRNSYNYRNIEQDVRDIQRAGKRFKKSWINADGPLERILILLVVVAVIGVTFGNVSSQSPNNAVSVLPAEYSLTALSTHSLNSFGD